MQGHLSRLIICSLGAALYASTLAVPARAAAVGELRVGAAKVDITPADLTHLNPMGGKTFAGVHDHIYARALLLDNGRNSAALVALDLIETGDTTELRERIGKELGIAAGHILITASHDHSAPRRGDVTPGALAHGGGPESAAYTRLLDAAIVDALKQAKASLQPARFGLKTGSADVSVNRDLVDDAAYDTPVFEVNGTPVARGCAENGIVDGLVGLIDKHLD